jgi:hypothetical protein
VIGPSFSAPKSINQLRQPGIPPLQLGVLSDRVKQPVHVPQFTNSGVRFSIEEIVRMPSP